MNRKISWNENHKYANEEKLALGEDENTSALINIAQEDDSNIFELLKSLWTSSVRFIILRCSRLLFTCYFWLLLFLFSFYCTHKCF